MDTSINFKGQDDDDGPEEGEIQDDDDDDVIQPIEISNSERASISKELDVSPRSRQCIERDIREFESARSRLPRSRLGSGEHQSSHSMSSATRGMESLIRRRERKSKSGLTQGKENRHVQRSKSPPSSKARHKFNGELQTSERCHDSSPLRRYSSQSSIDSEDKASPDHGSRFRGRQKRFLRSERGKRPSSSPDPDHIPSKRKPHHSVKCPLIQVLHSVAKETRLIAMESTETTPSGNSLKERLLNMGVISRNGSVTLPFNGESNVVNAHLNDVSTICLNSDDAVETRHMGESFPVSKDPNTENTQTEDTSDEVIIIPPFLKSHPEVVTLTDSDDNSCGLITPPPGKPSAPCSSKDELLASPALSSTSGIDAGGHKEILLTADLGCASAPEKCLRATTEASKDLSDDDEDVSQLRLLALQSKKHEQTPPGDDDVLQLRLAALKTAIVKKFKGRRKEKLNNETNTQTGSNPPLSPLDRTLLHLSPLHDDDEATSPIDMDIAETDDEEIESDTPKSPSHEASLQDLLPPPPPPDLPLDLFYHEQSIDTAINSMCLYPVSSSDELLPPPLPPYFQEMLEPLFETSLPPPLSMPPVEFVNDTSNLDVSLGCDPSSSEGNVVDGNLSAVFVTRKNSLKKRVRAPPISQSQLRLQSKIRPNLLEIPISSKSNSHPTTVELHTGDQNCPPDSMDIDSMIVLDEIFDSSPVHDIQNRSFEGGKGDKEDGSGEANHIKPNSKDELAIPTEQQISRSEDTVNSQEPDSRLSFSRKHNLEEEEQILRQRLLSNLANKRNNTSTMESSGKDARSSVNKTEVDVKKTNVELVMDTDRPQNSLNLEKISVSEGGGVSPISRLKQVSPGIQKAVANEKRIIVHLGEDSDSSVDYSDAEALGMMCVKNKEEWQRQVKEFDPNLFKMIITQLPPSKSLVKPPAHSKPCGQPKSRSKTCEKAPQFENLTDLETSVERFLRGVRSSHDAKVLATSSTNSTPVAVRHLPASQQAEYRRLKLQIAELEKQKVSQIKGAIPSPSMGKSSVKMNSSAKVISKSSLSSSNPLLVNHLISNIAGQSVLNSKKVIPSVLLPTKPAMSSKPTETKLVLTVQKGTQNPPQLNTPQKVPLSISQNKVKKSNINSLRVTLNGIDKAKREVSMPTSKSQSVSAPLETPSSIGLTNQSPLSGLLEQLAHDKLNSIEKKLVLERSFFLGELSALAKLLTQVDKSLEAQSRSATEVSNLLDQLCLAAGRWHAQNRTVTSIVAKVAQRQIELTQKHRHFVDVSNSCAKIGSHVHGKQYRIPSDKANFIRLQLKTVHEKTQALAKRRAREQDRKNILEKRAENCLSKLFREAKKIVPNSSKSSEKFQHSEGKIDPVLKIPPLLPSQSDITYKDKQKDVAMQQNQHLNVPTCQSQKVLDSTENVRSLLVSKILAYRTAQSKVRSAKAFFRWSRPKGIDRRNKRKVKTNSKLKDGNDNKDWSQELSDMDISLDGEENEDRTKFQDENNEVVDMALSPDMSSSPDGSLCPIASNNIASIDCKEMSPHTSSSAHCTFLSFENHQDVIEKETSGALKKIVKTKEKGLSSAADNNSDSCNKDSPGLEVNCSIESKPLLKDYISPLGGLKVLSCGGSTIRGKEDPYAILCPYDLNGKCQDSDCPFKHQQ